MKLCWQRKMQVLLMTVLMPELKGCLWHLGSLLFFWPFPCGILALWQTWIEFVCFNLWLCAILAIRPLYSLSFAYAASLVPPDFSCDNDWWLFLLSAWLSFCLIALCAICGTCLSPHFPQ